MIMEYENRRNLVTIKIRVRWYTPLLLPWRRLQPTLDKSRGSRVNRPKSKSESQSWIETSSLYLLEVDFEDP